MRIGYSFWGFLGNGILDTPDGGRSHRRTLIDALIAAGHEIVFLQPDRDLAEAGTDLTGRYRWDAGLPELDALMLEWRWLISGRNTTWCGAAGHTCDLHRQTELLDHYSSKLGLPTIVWDKDRKLGIDNPLHGKANVTICEPALHPSPGAVTLLFPVDDAALDGADPVSLSQVDRPLTLAYVGNQYDRDLAFAKFFAPTAAQVPHVVGGKWTDTSRWPDLRFQGRVAFDVGQAFYRGAVATVLLLPDRYAEVGHMTQRLFEAVLAGCVPITPANIRSADRFTPAELHVTDAAGVTALCARLEEIAGTNEHAELLRQCLTFLDLFRVSKQFRVLEQVLHARVVPAT